MSGQFSLTAGSKKRKAPNSDFPSELKIIGMARVNFYIYTGGITFSRVNRKDECNYGYLRK